MKKIGLFLLLSITWVVGYAQYPKTDAQLITNGNTVINAGPSQNTASRIGNDFLDLAYSKLSVIPLSVSGTNTYIAASSIVNSYSNSIFECVFQNGNTGAATLNINSLGAVNLQKLVSGSYTALASGDIQNNQQLKVWYDQPNNTFQVFLGGGSGSSVTPAALTKTDDTNVTLTLGGTPATSLLQATSLTLGWTGTLADARIASASTWNAKQTAITFGTGVQSALANNIGSTGAPILFNGAAGTFASGVATNLTGLPLSTGVTGNLSHSNIASTAVTPGSYTNANITIAADGSITAAANGSGGGVTSVAMTVPSFLSISGSPITTSGTLAVSLSGTALPIANGGTGSTTSPTFYGSIYSASSFSSLSGFTDNTSSGVTVSSNKLHFSGGTNDVSKTLDRDYYTDLENWTTSMDFSVITKPVTSGMGGGLGHNSYCANINYEVWAWFDMSTGANSGKIYLKNASNTITVTSTNALTFSTTDALTLIFERRGNLYIASVVNNTTSSSPVSVEWSSNMYSPATVFLDNSGKFAILSSGATFDVSALRISSSEIKNADMMLIGDSKIQGIFISEKTKSIAGLLRNNFNSVLVNAGSGERTEDILNRTAEIIALNPKIVLLGIGCNDVRSAVSLATTESNISSFVSTLNGAGITVYHLVTFREVSINMAPLAAWIRSTYPSNYIETYNLDSRMFHTDNVHPNELGNLWIYNNIMNSGLISNTLVKSTSSIYPDRIVGVSSDGNSQIKFGNTLLSTLQGGSLTSTTSNQAVLFGGADFFNNNWTARATTASGVSLLGATVGVFVNSGLTLNTTFTPTQVINIAATGLFVGGSTTPAGFIHTAAGTTSIPSAFFVEGVAPTVPSTGMIWTESANHLVKYRQPSSNTTFMLSQIGRSTAQTAAVASVTTYTVGSADESFEVSSNVNLTASTTNSFTVTCTYTDETNTSRTVTFSFVQNGVAVPIQTITNVTGVGSYCANPLQIRCKAATSITIATTGTFTSITYNVEGRITPL